MKVVFLDFDGVLLPQSVHFPPLKKPGIRAGAHPDCVAVLNKIIRLSGAKIVVSSAWRPYDGNVKVMVDLLQLWGCEGEVVGVTPWLNAHANGVYRHVPRGEEIQDWLNRSSGVESFAIIDDESDMAHLSDRLVQTEFGLGLKDEHVDPILHLLETPR